jgi:magnesium-transporting ATPase (P-type)
MDDRILKWLFDIKFAIDEIDSYFESEERNFFDYRSNTMLKRAVRNGYYKSIRSMNQKNKEELAVVSGIALIIISNIIGNSSPPFSILATPWVLTIVIAIINFPLYKTSFSKTVIYNYGLILFNDILVRLLAGGIDDDEGKAWISVMFILSFLISTIVMFVYGSLKSKNSKENTDKRKHMKTVAFAGIVTAVLFVLFNVFLIL